MSDSFLGFRKWILSLNNKMPPAFKAELKRKAEEAGVEMVKKYKDSEGRTRVSKP